MKIYDHNNNEITIICYCGNETLEQFQNTEIYHCRVCGSKNRLSKLQKAEIRNVDDWERQKGSKKADIFSAEKEGLFE